jgi:hypothetical protein
MSGELAVLLFIGNAILFWLWASYLVPLLQSKVRDARGSCPHCGLQQPNQ